VNVNQSAARDTCGFRTVRLERNTQPPALFSGPPRPGFRGESSNASPSAVFAKRGARARSKKPASVVCRPEAGRARACQKSSSNIKKNGIIIFIFPFRSFAKSRSGSITRGNRFNCHQRQYRLQAGFRAPSPCERAVRIVGGFGGFFGLDIETYLPKLEKLRHPRTYQTTLKRGDRDPRCRDVEENDLPGSAEPARTWRCCQ